MTVYDMTRDWEGTSVTATPRGRDVQLAFPLDVREVGEIRCYRIVLPYLPPSKNVYDGWMPLYQQGAKKKWLRDIAAEVEAQDMPRGLQKIGLSAVLVFATRARRDLSNYSQALHNFVPDALVRAGVVVDDSAGHIEIGPNWGVRFAYDLRNLDKKFRQRTHLAITMRVPS